MLGDKNGSHRLLSDEDSNSSAVVSRARAMSGPISEWRGPSRTDLCLHVCNLVRREVVLVERNFCLFKISQEPELRFQQEKQAFPGFPGSRRSTDTMNVIAGVIRRVKLNDPIHFRNVQSSRRDVCT
jgi:hypothetical protein